MKNISNITKCTAKIICFITCFILIHNFLYFFFSFNTSTRDTFENYYKNADNIDTIFIGSSHSYCSINPDIINDKTGVSSYNLGTPAQKLDASYYLLREANANSDIKTVYLELYYDMWRKNVVIGGTHFEKTSIEDTIHIVDFTRFSLYKYDYILHSVAPKYYIDTIFVERRYWRKVFDSDAIKKRFSDICNEINNKEDYGDFKGFEASYDSLSEGSLLIEDRIDNVDFEKLVSGEYLEDLYKIINYCKENDIHLVLYSAPVLDINILSCRDSYTKYVRVINKIAEENGLEYYDFNLCKRNFYSNDVTYYRQDMDHLNVKGSTELSELFAKIMNGEYKKQDVFYDTFEEKIINDDPTVYGIIINSDDSTEDIYIISNIDNDSTRLSYQINSDETHIDIYLDDVLYNSIDIEK